VSSLNQRLCYWIAFFN